jgi:hypothetical protein
LVAKESAHGQNRVSGIDPLGNRWKGQVAPLALIRCHLQFEVRASVLVNENPEAAFLPFALDLGDTSFSFKSRSTTDCAQSVGGGDGRVHFEAR